MKKRFNRRRFLEISAGAIPEREARAYVLPRVPYLCCSIIAPRGNVFAIGRPHY